MLVDAETVRRAAMGDLLKLHHVSYRIDTFIGVAGPTASCGRSGKGGLSRTDSAGKPGDFHNCRWNPCRFCAMCGGTSPAIGR